MPVDDGAMGLRGMRVLVSGAASGIGLACARAFAGVGARVGALDRDTSVSAAFLAGNGHAWATVDVRDECRLRGAVDGVVADLGGLDIVVGAAGVSGPFGKRVTQVSLAEWDEVIGVNLTGQFLLAKHTVGHLRESRSGAIVFVCSDSAFVATPGMVPYCASKGGLAQLTRALAVELRTDGVRVCSVCPSVVDTPMARADLGDRAVESASFPVHTPEQVARHVLYLASPESASLSGLNLLSDFGSSARSSFPA